MTITDHLRCSTTTGSLMPAHHNHRPNRYRTLLMALGAVCAVLFLAPAAHAAAPELSVSLTHDPTTFHRGDRDAEVFVDVTNTGDAPTSAPVTTTLILPAGLQLRAFDRNGLAAVGASCPSAESVNAGAPITCTSGGNALAPGQTRRLTLASLIVAADAANELTTSVVASTAGASDATAEDHIPVLDQLQFGPLNFSARSLDAAGDDNTVAGGHPYEATTSFRFPTFRGDDTLGIFPGVLLQVENVRNIWVELPPGFVGAAAAAKRCELSQLAQRYPSCPAASQVGTLTLFTPYLSAPQRLYNMKPEKGYPAQFAFKFANNAVVTYPQLRPRGGGYGLNFVVPGAGRVSIVGVTARLWGVPSDPAHDAERFGPVDGPPIPFLSNQSDCLDAQPTTKLYVDSWEHPARMRPDGTPDLSDSNWKSTSTPAPAITGCDSPALADQFKPTIDAGPSSADAGGSTAADTPSGYHVDLAFPQSNDPTNPDAVFDPSVPQAPQLKDATVTLPVGTAISPSAADGLDGCSDVPGDDQVNLDSINPVTCPDASKIGSVVGKSPLLASHDLVTDEVTGAEPIDGDVFLIKPHPGDLSASGEQDGKFRILIQLNSERYGLNVKLPGIVTADRTTGRLTARFTNNPQLPLKTLHLEFKGGDRAPLVNSPLCTSSATTTGVFTPWSRGGVRTDGVVVPGTPDATASSSFAIDKGANGAPCATSMSDLPFSPGFSAGLTDTQAGGSSPFVLRFTRQDGEQDLGSIDTSLPPGLLANIGAVPLCPEDQAATGTCDAASQVGTTTVGAGAGPSPVFLPMAGKDPTAVYLAGPYKGAPFSLSIVVPAQAGPFDLGNVVVRAALFVDQHDAHVTVKSDPLPTIRDGVPLRVRDVRVSIDRPGFMLSPTNCAQQAVTGTIRSAQGKSVDVSSPFAVTGCDALPFKPQFNAATSGKLAFKQGASFKVHVAVPAGDANIKSLATTLPRELPSRLIPTINNACVMSQFQADYTGCPADSFVGTVSAKTPILDQPLTGPVYIVAPPNDVPRLEIVLLGQGKAAGVRVDLEGSVIVDSGGGRSKVTFETVPDVPVTSFDVDFPAGPHSILDAPSNDLCKGPITLGLSVIGQNGKRTDTNPTVAVSNCPKIAAAKVMSAQTTSSGLHLRVLAPAEGRLVVSGSSLTTIARTANRKLTYTVTVPLTAKAKKALAKKGSVTTRASVYFKPVNAPKATTVKTKTLTVKKAKKTTRKGKR